MTTISSIEGPKAIVTTDSLTGAYLGDNLRYYRDDSDPVGVNRTISGECITLVAPTGFTLKKMSIPSPQINDVSQQAGLVTATPRDFTVLGQTFSGDYNTPRIIKVFRDVEAVVPDSQNGVPLLFDFERNTIVFDRILLAIESTNQTTTVQTPGDSFQMGLYQQLEDLR